MSKFFHFFISVSNLMHGTNVHAKFSFLQFFSVKLMDWFEHHNLPIFPYIYFLTALLIHCQIRVVQLCDRKCPVI